MRKIVKHTPVSPAAERIGSCIFHFRMDRQWTQREVAKRAGMSVAYLCDVENGKRRIGAERLYRIAKVFKVSMDVFFGKVK